jgi:glycosyltransferase involved in cell wall biosynthesis
LKRFDLLIRAASLLASKIPGLEVVIAGEGDLRPALEDLAKRLRVADIVHFLGWRKDLLRLIHAADCVVSCSNTETCAMVLVDAMAMEKPVVAAAAEDVASMIQHGHSGLLFPVGDLSGLCDRLLTIARSPESAKLMGKAARASVVGRFDPEGSVRQVLDLYRELVLHGKVSKQLSREKSMAENASKGAGFIWQGRTECRR